MYRKAALAIVPASLLCLSGLLSADDAEFFYPQSDSLPGVRTEYHSGKQWPLAPRPTGCPEPCIHRYHTAHYWPDPYRWQDRSSVRAHINAQSAAGWLTNTTLYDQHFNLETQELNDAGRRHLKWILLYAPPQRRQPWVQAGDSAEISQVRLANVQALAAEMAPQCHSAIMLRVCQPYGASAQEVDLVRRAYLSSMPDPRISYVPQSGSSAGGSGGSSSSGSGGGQGGR